MPANIPAGALGRPPEEFLQAVDVCADEWRRDDTNLWVGGMVAAAWWVCGYTPHPPMEPDKESVADRDAIVDQLMMAGTARLGDAETTAWARGVYRMLIYATGYSDEVPLLPTRPAPARP
ncbi:hypothetical protein AB0B39_23730 [Micromonospora sp. NPDC049114]|uniref:hypothetical protein n=1 Tax=Micromonospora sp. NPDC049114 TaxID=3155498 RepID=UPI0033FBDBC4